LAQRSAGLGARFAPRRDEVEIELRA